MTTRATTPAAAAALILAALTAAPVTAAPLTAAPLTAAPLTAAAQPTAAQPAQPAAVSRAPAEAAAVRRGPETNLPLPRFVTVRADKAYLRRGPSKAHRIDWVYRRAGYPLEVVAEHERWRQVRDHDAVVGWMHTSMLRNARAALVLQDRTPLRRDPRPDAALVAKAEAGVVARLRACVRDWCRLQADGRRGWVEKRLLWGVRPGEAFD